MSVDQFPASLRSWEPAALASRWQTLEAKGKSSFFLGWTWTGAWLAATGVRPDLLAVQVGGRDISLALIGRARMQRPLGKLPGLATNQSGESAAATSEAARGGEVGGRTLRIGGSRLS